MTDLCVVYEDPLEPDAPAKVLVPSPEWLELAMSGGLPPIWVYLDLKRDEQKAIEEGRHSTFRHDPKKHALQWEAERIGPLTEEEAILYLIMKDIPERVWNEEVPSNKRRFAIVRKNQLPQTREWRNAWRLAQ